MKAAKMHCIKVSDIDEHEDLSRQPLLSLMDGSSRCFLPHPLWAIDARRVMTCILQEAGSVGHTLAIRDVQLYTPPPPGRYIFI